MPLAVLSLQDQDPGSAPASWPCWQPSPRRFCCSEPAPAPALPSLHPRAAGSTKPGEGGEFLHVWCQHRICFFLRLGSDGGEISGAQRSSTHDLLPVVQAAVMLSALPSSSRDSLSLPSHWDLWENSGICVTPQLRDAQKSYFTFLHELLFDQGLFKPHTETLTG